MDSESSHRSKVFSIPVQSDLIIEFTKRDELDEYHQLNISDQINKFIFDTVNAFGGNVPDEFHLELPELVYNSYDAYAKQGLTQGSQLDLTITVQLKENTILVQLKDNAAGFSGLRGGKLFKLKDIKAEHKDKKQFSGGKGVGLKDFSQMLKKNNIDLFFSNAPKGAVVTMKFPKDSTKVDGDSTEQDIQAYRF